MTVNPFNIGSIPTAPGSTKSSATPSETTFEQQLSAALAESLGKLGVTPDEINITVRKDAGSTNGRQITVSYHIDGDNPFNPAPAPPKQGTVPTPVVPVGVTPVNIPEVNHDWAPYSGPRDRRDAMPIGGGGTTASGAPLIAASKEAVANQYGYTGPGARNPYFTSPSNPLRPGYVLGFDNWFQNTSILGGASGPVPANKTFYSTEEGAQEALRLVQQLMPDAKISDELWGGGIFVASNPTFNIELSDGRKLNAGGILASYYNQGHGVTAYSDDTLKRVVGMAA